MLFFFIQTANAESCVMNCNYQNDQAVSIIDINGKSGPQCLALVPISCKHGPPSNNKKSNILVFIKCPKLLIKMFELSLSIFH